ncbi:MAG: LysR family transcriptional regulator [Bdellovibrionaceae bacterium]|nr:LysR family transcriptional regulator [Pseudobdellovibrionaceae bacterium]
MVPNFSDLIYFVEIAETQNISRAAERLGVSQPSLSTSIKRLEDSLDTQLLLRTKSGVRLTKDGHYFMAKVKDLIQQWGALREGIQQSSTEATGRYRIGCHSAVAQFTITQFLPELMKQHPKMEIELYHDLSRKVCEQVISFELDIGIVVNPVSHPDLVIKEICQDTIQFWISPQTKDVNKDVLICNPQMLQTQDLLQRLRKKKIEFARTINTSSLEVIADLVTAGAGIGILPTRVAQNHHFKLFNKDLPHYNDRICLVFRADMPKTYANRLLIEAISSIK